ncbi:MAG TPA: hypothetical protein HA306_07715 [Methanosarcina sp.]|nr:hypothetical protein [Methanosarcina sp.]
MEKDDKSQNSLIFSVQTKIVDCIVFLERETAREMAYIIDQIKKKRVIRVEPEIIRSGNLDSF